MDNKKRNQANLLAKEYIVTALIQLLENKPLSSVSISEITRRAGVSRMAYYRNYRTKEDIFSSHMEDILREYREEARGLGFEKGYYKKENLIHCFTYFDRHKEFLECLFQNNLGHLFLNAISSYVLESWYKPEYGIGHYYALQAFAGALFNLYISWALKGAKETPQEMAEILYSYAKGLF